MNEIDVKKLIELLQKAMRGGSERSEASQERTIADRSAAPLKKENENDQRETFNKLLEESIKKYTDINEKIKIAEENRKDLIDDEQIILGLQEEYIEQLKNQFQINQKNLLNLIEQLKVGKEKGTLSKKEVEDLDEKITILKKITLLQGADIEKDKKQKELKEGIFSIAKQTWEISKQYGSELEKHIIAISKANGGYAEFLGNLREGSALSQAMTLGTGITGEDNMLALEALSDSFIGLTTYSEEAISSMQVATAQLTKVGVSSAMSAKGMDSLVTAMGKTPEQAGKIQESFVQMAAKNRLALSSVSQAFAENSSRFVGYGEQMTKVLAGLAEQSLKTGVSISGLVKITQQFDTFEGAANAVGNLNAILGGDYLNSIELLTASDDERIKILKDGVAASGMQWSSMNRFQQMAVANAAGISDLNEASKIFGQTSLQNTRQQAEQAETQKTLAEQANLMSSMNDKLKSSFNGLYIAVEPFLSLAMQLVEWFGKFLNFIVTGGGLLGSFGTKIMSVLVSVTLGIGYLAIKNKVLTGSFNFVAGAIARATAQLAAWKAANATGGGAMGGITKFKQGPASAGVSPVSSATSGLLANAGNMLKAAGAILIFAAALWVLAKALQEFSSKEINDDGIKRAGASMVVLLGIMFVLDKAKSEITKGAIVVGIMSLSLLAFGLSLGIMSKVDWKLVGVMSLALIGIGLAIAGIGLAVSGPQGVLLAIGIGVLVVLAVALAILGVAIKLIVDSIKESAPAFTNLTDSLTKLFAIKDLKQNFSDLESFFSQLSNINVEPINNLANAIYNLATNLQTLAAIPSKMGINVTGKTDLAETINKTVASAAEATSAVSQASSRTAAQTLIPAQQTTAFVPLIVQIDKKTIIQVLQKDIESIAKGTALDTISAVGIVQSNSNIQDLLSGYSTAEEG